MPGTIFSLMLDLAAISLLTMAVAAPLMCGKIRCNRLYGIRMPKTLGDERCWYPANTFGGRVLFFTGLGQLFSVVALYLFPPMHANYVAYLIACEVVFFLSLLVACIRIMVFVKRL
jgi:uncharacterized membrane protein